MNIDEKKRAYKLAENLKYAGKNHGLVLVQGQLVIRDGINNQDIPAMFDEADLRNAVELGLLQENHVSGSFQWIWYVPTKRIYRTRVWLTAAPNKKYTVVTAAESEEQAGLSATEAIRLFPLPGMGGNEMEFETSGQSRPIETGDDYNFIIYNLEETYEYARG